MTARKRPSPPVKADSAVSTTTRSNDGVGLVYVGTELSEAVTETPEALAYRVERGPGGVVETPITPRPLV